MPEVVQLPSPVFDESTAMLSRKKRKCTSVVRHYLLPAVRLLNSRSLSSTLERSSYTHRLLLQISARTQNYFLNRQRSESYQKRSLYTVFMTRGQVVILGHIFFRGEAEKQYVSKTDSRTSKIILNVWIELVFRTNSYVCIILYRHDMCQANQA
jgi:hypothetical protein